ncbi:MAG TPA: metal-dependent hydrolase [Rhizobacter sp.]
MDSLSQIALGASVGVAVMCSSRAADGRRTAVWKAALWGAVCGTLPDLDVFVDHGDAIRNMVMHRSESHALFWLSLLSLPLAALIARLHGEWASFRRWWLAVWLMLVTHPLLDAMTVYGTRLLLPFTDQPYAVGSIFIIDPLYTVPLLAGVLWALFSRGSALGLKANVAGLAFGTAYLAWGVAAQAHVERIARAALQAQGVKATQVLVTPTPFNTLLWRVVAIEGDRYHEGFRSLLDGRQPMSFDPFPRGLALMPEVQAIDGVQRVVAFSRGYYKLHVDGARLAITDLRMGQEPTYTFSFAVAERHSQAVPLQPPVQQGSRPDVERALSWLWRRALGEPLPPPR